MACNETLARRVRKILEKHPGYVEKKMFGGVCFLIKGNMACGVLNDDLIVRVGTDRYEDALKSPHARQLNITGRPMKGWVMVSRDGHASDDALRGWVRKGMDLALSLPEK